MHNESDDDIKSYIEESVQVLEKTILEETKKSSDNKIVKLNQEIGFLSSPPILRMKFLNWASDSENRGLFGRSNGFKFSPDLENRDSFFKKWNIDSHASKVFYEFCCYTCR